jgi:hypothetical protein
MRIHKKNNYGTCFFVIAEQQFSKFMYGKKNTHTHTHYRMNKGWRKAYLWLLKQVSKDVFYLLHDFKFQAIVLLFGTVIPKMLR